MTAQVLGFPHRQLHQWRMVLACAHDQVWKAPVLACLSLLATFAEVITIGLVVAFLYAAIGPGIANAHIGGMAGRVWQAIAGYAGDSAQVMAIAVFVLVAAKALIRVLHDMLGAQVKHSITERTRLAVYSQYLDISYGYIQSRDRGELMHVLTAQCWAVAEAFYCLIRFVASALAIALFTAVLLALSWQITLLAAAGAAIVFGLMRLVARPVRRMGKEAQDEHEEVSRQMLATLQGMRTIRAYAQEGSRKRAFARASARTRRIFVRVDQVCSVITPISELTYLGVLALIVLFAAGSQTPFATTLAAVALLYRLQPHLREFESNLLALVRLDAPLTAVANALDRSDKIYPRQGSKPCPDLRGEIRFENVWLSYPNAERPALRDIDLSLPIGKTTALIGPSGAGKTSIIALLLRLYEPTRGRILIDGVPLSDYRRESWLGRIAVAGQDAELVDDTVAANIRLGCPQATQQEIEHAARLAGVHDFIAALPKGYDSFIGTQGLNLSGGQRQRVGLARALICRPQVLILDEATNAVDAPLESEIRAAIATVMAGKTVVLITHRLESLKGVDHFVQIAHGAILDVSPELQSLPLRRAAR
jgi:subfamily B ATP-binding cassette protein MsbA